MEKKTHQEIAKEALDKINKAKADKLSDEAKKKAAEAKGAAPDSSTEKEKTEEEKALVAQEKAQAEKDEAILLKDEKLLTAEEKTRKQEILDNKKKAPKELDEDKVKKRKAEIQAEIDKLISEKKVLEEVKVQSDKMKQDIAFMQKELDDLKTERGKIDAEKNIPEEQKLLKKKEEERVAKYLDEDKELPREQRREMTDDEFQEWELENPRAAYRWDNQQDLRRSRERATDINSQKRDKFVKDFLAKQEESNTRVIAAHPELDTAKRERELKAAGKTSEEIQSILCKENEKYRISAEIVQGNPDMYLMKENGPELVAAEMEKRIKNPSPAKKEEDTSEIERLKAELEAKDAEIARLTGIDETADTTRLPEKKKPDDKKTEFQLKQIAIANKAGISETTLNARIAKRAKAGAE